MPQEDTADAYDAFDDSLFSLFNVPPIAFSTGSSNDYTTYTPPADSQDTRPLKLFLSHPPADLYQRLQANQLWLSGVFLADRIATGRITFSRPVAELGAGAGLPSIIVARAGGTVVCTDYNNPEVIGTIRRNFETEFKREEEEGGEKTSSSPRWAVEGHTWGEDPSPLLAHSPEGFDLILADTLWSSRCHAELADSIMALLHRDGVVHVAAGLHTGRGPVNRFMALIKDHGLVVYPQGEVRWQPGGGWAEYAAADDDGEEERGVVVYYTLHRHSL